MEPGNIEDLCRPSDHLVFADSEAYRKTFANVKIERCIFRNVRLRETVFDGGCMKHNQFVDAYLNGATFRAVELTGTTFDHCDLRHAIFDRCKLWYVEFHRCHLNFESIKDSLPPEVNLRRQVLRSLRVNAAEMGDAVEADRLLVLELAAERQEKYCVFTASDEYFSQNFNLGQRFRAFGSWVVHKALSLVWGYGLQLKRLLLTGILAIFFFAIVFWNLKGAFCTCSGEMKTLSFWESIYTSAVTFSTLGSSDFSPADGLARFTVMAESLSGCVFLGLFAASAYRWIRR